MMQSEASFIRECRSEVGGTVSYTVSRGESGSAVWRDISRTGARLRLGRYVRPGRVVVLDFPAPQFGCGQYRLQARVVWCRQVQDGADFELGLLVVRDEPESALAFASVLHHARAAANNAAVPEVFRVWPMFRSAAEPQPEAVAEVPRAV